MKINCVSEKARVRAAIRALLAAMSPEQQTTDSARARALLTQQEIWRRVTTVLFYAPLPGELDVWPLALDALKTGKRIALPRFDNATDAYLPALIEDPQRDLILGKLGIREPGPNCKPVDGNEIELVLVPGVAFDLRGFRLGRGKGYYDRLLRVVSGIKCGVAFEQQLVRNLPVEPHDFQLDYILTPMRWIIPMKD